MNRKVIIAKTSFLVFFYIFICKYFIFIAGKISYLCYVFDFFLKPYKLNNIDVSYKQTRSSCWCRKPAFVTTFFFYDNMK